MPLGSRRMRLFWSFFNSPQRDATGKHGHAVKQQPEYHPPPRSALKLLHEHREVRDFPMLRDLSVLDSVELKGHRVDLSASGFEANEFAFVRAADGIQDSDAVALSHDRRNRQLQIRKGGTNPSKVLLEGFPPGTLPRPMTLVTLPDYRLEPSTAPSFLRRQKTPYDRSLSF